MVEGGRKVEETETEGEKEREEGVEGERGGGMVVGGRMGGETEREKEREEGGRGRER